MATSQNVQCVEKTGLIDDHSWNIPGWQWPSNEFHFSPQVALSNNNGKPGNRLEGDLSNIIAITSGHHLFLLGKAKKMLPLFPAKYDVISIYTRVIS